MPTQIKANPIQKDIGRSFVGKSVMGFTITAPSALTDELGPNGVLQAMYFALGQRTTPVLISALHTTDTAFDFYVEGDFPSDDYNDDGTPVTLAEHMQAVIRDLGTVGVRDADLAAATGETESAGIDLSTTTVAAIANAVFYADHVPA